MCDDIIIKAMKKNDYVKKTAQLMYETSNDLFKAMFGKKEKAMLKIENLIKLENNIFSFKNILTAKIGEDINGILVGYDVNTVNPVYIKNMNNDFKKAMSFFARIRCWTVLMFSHHIMAFNDIEGYYIQNLCVDSANRGKGIGYRLLEYCIADNKEKSNNNIYLDVESKNEIALNLYRKIKFVVLKEINIKLAGITLYRMKHSISE